MNNAESASVSMIVNVDDSEEEEDLLGKESEIAKMRAALAKSKFDFVFLSNI